MKSFPSFGPTLPPTNPLNMLGGMYILSDNLTSSLVREVVPLRNNETFEIFSSNNSL